VYHRNTIAVERVLAQLEELCCAKVDDLLRPGQVPLRLGVTGSACCCRPPERRVGTERADYTGPVAPAFRQIAALVFDLDGTLLDSLAVQLESYRRAILDSGGRDHSHEEILRSFPLGSAALMLEALIERPVGAQAVTRYEAHLRERSVRVRPYAGIPEALRELSAKYRLGVFTAANTSAAEVLLETTGLESFFEVVVGADRTARIKPAPDGLLLACRALGTQPSDVAYVGDGPSDMAVARACGALGVAAGWGHQFVADREADVVVDSPDKLPRLFAVRPGVGLRPATTAKAD
jgi:HAD superfamily hydrolase (TIGR01549 family)